MLKYLPLPFVQEKVLDLQDALFFNSCDTPLKIADQLIHARSVDELGQIWFVVPRPKQRIEEFDQEFPVRLDFFKKGKQFYLKVAGKAFIVNDPEELSGLDVVDEKTKQKAINRELVLMKVKIQFADYYETASEPSLHWSAKAKSQFYKLFSYQNDGPRAVEAARISFQDMVSFPKIYSN